MRMEVNLVRVNFGVHKHEVFSVSLFVLAFKKSE